MLLVGVISDQCQLPGGKAPVELLKDREGFSRVSKEGLM